MQIAERIQAIRETMHKACQRSGRADDEVGLIAVTKFVEIERIAKAVDAGITAIGENRAQEFAEKLNFYKQNGLRTHFIGQLQTNKVKYICGTADLIQSVDRTSLLDAIAQCANKQNTVQDILVEVNIGAEPQKGGIPPDALPVFLDRIATLSSVRMRGFMCVPPAAEPEAVRPYFRRMRTLYEQLRQAYPTLPIDTLSMGMSHDYPVAIEEGTTLIRVGTAIFGARNTFGGTQNG